MTDVELRARKNTMANIALWCGVAAFVVGGLPFLNGYLLWLMFLVFVFGALSIVFAVIALCKKQSIVKSIAGVILSVVGVILEYVFISVAAGDDLNRFMD